MIKQLTIESGARKRASGFTLIELMIVVAIIGIIAAVVYPSYQKNVQKSRRADAKIALTEAATRQERFFSEKGYYAATADLGKFVTNADGESSPDGHYTISVDNTTETAGCLNGGATPFYSCFILTATATGVQATDTECATLTLSHLGQKGSTGGGTCW